MDLKQFQLCTEAEEGKWFDLGEGARVKVRSDESEAYQKILRGIIDSHPNFKKLPRKTQEKLHVKSIASGLLLDWEGVKEDGEEIEPTQENKERVLTDYPAFRRYVVELAASISNFQKEMESD